MGTPKRYPGIGIPASPCWHDICPQVCAPALKWGRPVLRDVPRDDCNDWQLLANERPHRQKGLVLLVLSVGVLSLNMRRRLGKEKSNALKSLISASCYCRPCYVLRPWLASWEGHETSEWSVRPAEGGGQVPTLPHSRRSRRNTREMRHRSSCGLQHWAGAGR